jgi:hypothetical protein
MKGGTNSSPVLRNGLAALHCEPLAEKFTIEVINSLQCVFVENHKLGGTVS